MKDIDFILNRLKENEKIAKKFHLVESKILSILNFKDFFEVLLSEIENIFDIPFAWITFMSKNEISYFINSLEKTKSVKNRMNLINKSFFFKLLRNHSKPLLINKDLKPYLKLLPPGKTFLINSLAMTPITLDGEIIGSLNLADFSKERFKPGIDTSLLEQLSLKISLCLSNVSAHEKLKLLAFQDPLTGLNNRRVMGKVLQREFYRSKRYGSTLSLIFIDVNDFKKANDIHGHDIGDGLLKYIATTLNKMSRKSDIVTRYAGDEFVLVLPETSLANAEKLGRHLKKHLAKNPFEKASISLPISISFGIASTEDDSIENPDRLLKQADNALYESKKGKDTNRPRAEKINNIIKLNRRRKGDKTDG